MQLQQQRRQATRQGQRSCSRQQQQQWQQQRLRPVLRARPRSSACSTSVTCNAIAGVDTEREEGRSYRRVIFDAERWREHRATSRYFRHVKDLLTSRIARGLLGPMVYVASICTTVCVYHTALDWHLLQRFGPADYEWPTLSLNSSGIFSISTFALSLLLVFRTNSSYERWGEARDNWRMLVNEAVHLARQAEQWLPGDERAPIRDALLRWLRAFPLSLMWQLRQQGELVDAISGLLEPEEAAVLLRSRNAHLTVLSAIGQLIASSDMRIESKTHMDESVRVLQESSGACEKLLTTPIPLSYTRHTGRFLVLWTTCVPFVIWQELGWFSIPVSSLLTFLLFGIEEIGVQIEEPFGILPIEAFCDEVQIGIQQASEDHALLSPCVARIAAASVPRQSVEAAAAVAAAAALGGAGGSLTSAENTAAAVAAAAAAAAQVVNGNGSSSSSNGAAAAGGEAIEPHLAPGIDAAVESRLAAATRRQLYN